MTTSTRTRKPRTCGDCHIQLNRSNCDPRNNCPDVCNRCFDMAGYENDHNDGGHENGDLTGICPLCDDSIRTDRSRKGHTGTTIPKEMQSHAACYAANSHPKTKAGREACRKGRN